MTSECDGTDDVRLTLESEFAELDVDYGCSLEQSINEGHSSAHFSTSGEPETSQIIPFSAASPVPIEESASDVEEAQGMFKEFSNSQEICINVLKVDHQLLLTAGMPSLTDVKGLDEKRQWYLYEQIRPFCKTNLAADFTCPKPNVPKPSGSSEDTVTSQSRSGQNEQCTSKGTKR